MSNIDDTLSDRYKTYGPFIDQARITQKIKRVFEDEQSYHRLADDQKETLSMIASKIARILNGNPDYDDSWHDIAGYATLVCNRLQSEATDAFFDDSLVDNSVRAN